MTNVFMTSDSHLKHSNIMRYCNRPFATVEEMDEKIISNWNSVVKTNDVVYHMGDFAFCRFRNGELQVEKYIRRLNGAIHLIIGNHDKREVREANGFAWVGQYRKVIIGEHKVILCHYPFEIWDCSHFGSIHCHGHCHNNPMSDIHKLRVNVAMDLWNFMPVSFDQILDVIKTKEFVPINDREEE